MYKIETAKDRWKLFRSILELLVLLAVVLAAVRALRVSQTYQPYDPTDPAVVSGADCGLLVLSYFGVDRQGTDTLISTAQLDEQLSTLHDLGYVTVTQQDVNNYFRLGTPLPDKALFLLFEDGRRDTALFAEKLLEKYNFKATILSYADNFAEKDPKFLSPDDLKDLEQSGYWELGTNGYRLSYINSYDRYHRFLGQMTSDEFVQVNQYLGRDYNHYLMDYIRDENRVPLESESEMERRITADYRAMEEIYDREVGALPGVYCLMHSNTGRFGTSAGASRVNEENIRDLFSINLNRDGYAWNDHASSIYDLSRLQPQAYWTTNHLLMRLWDDLPEGQKGNITFVTGKGRAAEREQSRWTLTAGAAEFDANRILLTSTPQGEGRLTLHDVETADAELSVRLRGNVIGTQTVYLRTRADGGRYVAVSLQNGNLVLSQQQDGNPETLFTYDLHQLEDEKDLVSVEEDSRAALAAEYQMRGRFADSAADSAIFYQAARRAEAMPARTVAEGAEEYRPETQISQAGDVKLHIRLEGGTLQVSVNGKDVTGEVRVSVTQKGGVALGCSWGGWGYSQRSIADDVYDGVFQDLYLNDGTTRYDNRLHGAALLADGAEQTWNRVLNWFITHL